MTQIDLLNLLISKFPRVYFNKIEVEHGVLKIYTFQFNETINNEIHLRFLTLMDRDAIKSLISGFQTPVHLELIEETVDTIPNFNSGQFIHNPVQYIYASNYNKRFRSEFSERDEALWYDNVNEIFAGNFKKNDLYFYDSKEYSCYVDYSSFNNIDIRNHLFLFQVVYITLPYEKNIKSWLSERDIKVDEFFELVKRNRIKIILTQPEYRYDIGFINEIYNLNPNSVISRRALATLQQIDIVDISDNYLFNDIKIINELKNFCNILGEVMKINPGFIYEMLVWPIKARRTSFERLNTSGLFGLPSFGVNTAVEKSISNSANKDLSFEFNISASSIHLANALNATYFPFKSTDGFSDHFFANLMGEFLNFYKNATIKSFKSLIDNKDKVNSGILPIEPVEIFKVNDYDSITELEKYISKDVIYPKNKKLIEYLSELPDNQRKEKIIQYNNAVQENINNGNKNNGVIDLGENILVDNIGVMSELGYLGTVFSLLKMGGKTLNPLILLKILWKN